ncbi:MAG: G patch domain-containing protein [Asgard group archaeon]|nr:G patch domain-containing protein [Asgard group archaeon]
MSGIKISLKKKPGSKLKKPIINQDEKESKKLISSYSKDDVPQQTNTDKPIIKLKQRNKKILHLKEVPSNIEEEDDVKLAYGVTTFEKTDDIKQQSFIKKRTMNNFDSDDESEESDNEKRIPVEEFGAAFLRGLGWNDNNDEEKDKKEEKQQEILNHRQKGITLGIGAKPVDHEILQDLQSTEKGIPIIKRRKLK